LYLRLEIDQVHQVILKYGEVIILEVLGR
jgi:hypothetical protein